MQAFLSSADFFFQNQLFCKKSFEYQTVLDQVLSCLIWIHVDCKVFISVFLSNIDIGCIKETSQGDVSFAHPKHMCYIIDS